MKNGQISNIEFLESVATPEGSIDTNLYILPHEANLVDLAMQAQRSAFEQIIEQKIAVSGGDDWHDGAFRATDNEAKIISGNVGAIARYNEAVVVEYPTSDEERVTIGSKVVVGQASFSFPISIVGFHFGYTDDLIDADFPEEPVTPTSLESPLARAILSHTVGFNTFFVVDGRKIEVSIVGIDQSLVRKSYEISNSADITEIRS